MVDWKNENTLATPSIDINRVQILERRAYVITALEEYYSYQAVGSTVRTNRFISKLTSLFFEVEGLIKRRYDRETLDKDDLSYTNIKEIMFSKSSKFVDYYKVWEQINLLLDNIGLTKIDTKQDYDKRNPELENKVHNL